MAMTAVRLSYVNVWNGVVLALDEQNVRLYWRVLKCEGVIGVRYSVLAFEGVIGVRCSMTSLCYYPFLLQHRIDGQLTRIMVMQSIQGKGDTPA